MVALIGRHICRLSITNTTTLLAIPTLPRPPQLSAIMTMLTLPFLLSSFRNIPFFLLSLSRAVRRNYCNQFYTRPDFECAMSTQRCCAFYFAFLLSDFALMLGITSVQSLSQCLSVFFQKGKLWRMMQQQKTTSLGLPSLSERRRRTKRTNKPDSMQPS